MRYSGKRCIYEGHKFASHLERNAYIQLCAKYEKSSILLHPKFTVQEGFIYQDKKIPAITYIADFQIGNIVIDVKPWSIKYQKILIMTDSSLKIKMFKLKYGNLYDFRIMYELKKEWYLK